MPGIHLHHGNRLESLVNAMAHCLRVDPADPLTPDVVLVPHPGMAQWLKMRLADALGIAANLQFPLPAAWFGRLAGTGLRPADNLAWSRDAMTWRLFGLRDAGPGPLAATAHGGEREALARWQLAGQIADLFDRYQLQRPDWLIGWTRERARSFTASEAEAWQAMLWRQLVDMSATGEREALDRRLDPRPPAGAALPVRLFAFGFAALPERFLDGLYALAVHIPVHMFFPNPCRWYWGDLLTEREQLASSRRLGYKSELDPQAEGHALLARLGGVGRDFLHRLYAREIPFASENEHFEPAADQSILSQMQNRMLDLDPGELRWSLDDGSVRLLTAPNRRRELEALHDLLLALFDDNRLNLHPHEVAVMVPKLSDYAPMVEAVFGGQPRERRIPWQLTDLNETERHPLPALFLKLIDLPVWRFGLSEVLDALARPAFGSAFGIDDDELPRLAALLEEAGARWGLDGEFRAHAGAGDDGVHTFRFAIERLLAGWLLGEGVDEANGVAPYAALRGDDIDLVGRFVACLDALDRWRGRLADERSLAEWATSLVELRDACLADSADDEENAALLRLTAALDRWIEGIATAATTVVSRRVIHDSVAESLRSHAVSALPGEGVNICAMVPLRGLPFRVVVLLGLGEGEFPRRERELPGDLCRVAPRPGDRSIVAEDRYLFLEAIASTRDVLVLSHVERDQETGQLRAPSSILGEFRDYLRDAAFAGDGDALDARIERVAPLPTDPRHFGSSDSARHVPSYAGEWLLRISRIPTAAAEEPPAEVRRAPSIRLDVASTMPSPPLGSRVAPERRLGALARDDDEKSGRVAGRSTRRPTMTLTQPHPVPWNDVRAFLIDPARRQLRWRGVDLGERIDPVKDDEPFVLDGLGAYRVRAAIMEAFTRGTPVVRDEIARRLRAQAMLPPGRAGDQAFATVWGEAWRTRQRYETIAVGRHPAEFQGRTIIDGVAFDVRIAGVDDDGLIRSSVGKLKGKRRLAAWLDLLALSLLRGTTGLTATLVGLDGSVVLPAPDDARTTLERLLNLWRRARSEPLPLYPEASAAYAQAASGPRGDPEGARKKAHAAWCGDDHHPGEREDAACFELSRCFPAFDADPFTDLAIAVYAPVFSEPRR